jgi:peptidoglycan/LPS O-acetylase OafA/YrhL
VLLLFEFAASGRFPAQWWTYFVFVQNFSPTLSYFFGPSWSLSIEEWSYLTIPLVLLLLPVKKHSGFSIFLFTVAWALLIFFGRYWMIHQPMPDYDAGIRKNIPLRLDAIIFGFAMANIKLHYRKIFEWLGSALVFTGVIVLFAAINLLVPNALVYDFVGEKTIPGSMGFSAIGIFIALLLPFLSQHQWMKRAGEWRWLRIFFTRISLYSYCMYLVHGTVYHYVITRPGLSWPWLGQVTLALVIIVALAALSYRMIEKPILDWRDRNVRIIR